MYFRSRKNKTYQGVIAGAVGGLVASWTMTRFQVLLSNALTGQPDPHKEQGEDSTVKTAKKISTGLFGHELSPEEKKAAGPIVHYAYGTGIGALYGGLAQRHEPITSGFGSAYGAAAWALGDEIAVPALGLGRKPAETPLSEHFQTLAAHLVYGITLEGIRRVTVNLFGVRQCGMSIDFWCKK
jgi:uncharacterized membrane protein YagU involved in acid resistance